MIRIERAIDAASPVPGARMRLLKVDRVPLVKCIVEGHGDAMLASGWTLIEKSRPTIVIEIEQRHCTASITGTSGTLTEAGYEGHSVQTHRPRPLAGFDVRRHQLALIPDGFTPYGLLRSYVCDVFFTPSDREPPSH